MVVNTMGAWAIPVGVPMGTAHDVLQLLGEGYQYVGVFNVKPGRTQLIATLDRPNVSVSEACHVFVRDVVTAPIAVVLNMLAVVQKGNMTVAQMSDILAGKLPKPNAS